MQALLGLRPRLPACVFQLQNQSELRAPTAEKAAFFLDAAIASRRGSQQDCDEDDHRNSHMLFTLHLYQYRMEKSGKGGSKWAPVSTRGPALPPPCPTWGLNLTLRSRPSPASVHRPCRPSAPDPF